MSQLYLKLLRMAEAVTGMVIRAVWLLLSGARNDRRNWEAPLLLFRTAKLGDYICSTPALKLIETNTNGSVRLITGFSSRKTKLPGGKLTPWTELTRCIERLDVLSVNLYDWIEARRQVRAKGWHQTKSRIVVLAASGEGPLSLVKKLIYIRSLGLRGGIYGVPAVLRVWARRKLQDKITHQSKALYLIGISALLESRSLRIKTDCDRYYISVELKHRAWAQGIWREISNDRKLRVVVCPGGAREHKRWPLESYQLLLHSKSLRNAAVILVGDEADRRAFSSKLELNKHSRCMAGRMSLAQSAALISEADIFIGNDSGPAHMAAALNIPTIAIFSGIHRAGLWEPLGEYVQTPRFQTECQGCQSELACPAGTSECIKGVKVSDVTASLESAIRKVVFN
jgi:hypothetical protein